MYEMMAGQVSKSTFQVLRRLLRQHTSLLLSNIFPNIVGSVYFTKIAKASLNCNGCFCLFKVITQQIWNGILIFISQFQAIFYQFALSLKRLFLFAGKFSHASYLRVVIG